MKKLLTVLILAVLVVICCYLPKIARALGKNEQPTFCVSIPVAFWASGRGPCLNVKIENRQYLLLLDLGYNGDASLYHAQIEKLQQKSFLKTSTSWGIRGKKYDKDVYKIPHLKINNILFHPVILDELNLLLDKDSALTESEGKPLSPVGRLGWQIFNKTALFLDLYHSTVAISDSVETFKKQNPSLSSFIKVPILDDNDMVEFEMMTSRGPLRCLLDTGATWNIMHTENPEEIPLEIMTLEKENFVDFTDVQIGGEGMGPVTFRPLPLKLPISIDAIIGMEFLFKHQVLIDFNNREIYFSKDNPITSCRESEGLKFPILFSR